MQIVLQQYGTSLSKKANAFEVKTTEGRHRLAPSRLDSIVVSPGISISSDAMLLAIAHQIDMIFLDQRGDPKGRVWSHQYGSISSIRKHQVYFAHQEQGAAWVVSMIQRRMTGQQELLSSLIQSRKRLSPQLEPAINTLDSLLLKLDQLSIRPLDDALSAQLRGWEGAGSHAYFSAISQAVPTEYRFQRRSRRPARDMFNCALNYLYGMLYGRIEGSLIKAGIDPYLGVFHRDDYNRPVLVYDMIEPFRVWAESVLLSLCLKHAIGLEMFSRRRNGYWLETLGKQLVIGSMNNYLEEVVQMNKRRRSRLTHLQEECHGLAKTMLDFDPDQNKYPTHDTE